MIESSKSVKPIFEKKSEYSIMEEICRYKIMAEGVFQGFEIAPYPLCHTNQYGLVIGHKNINIRSEKMSYLININNGMQ